MFSAGYVFVSWKSGKERLYSAIIVFLILIAIVGGKTVEFFGFETNTGNIFYASVFLATYFLIERYGRHEGARSIPIGIVGAAFFLVLAQLAILFVGAASTAPLSAALTEAFAPMSRIAIASLIAYAVSQTLNVYLYIFLKKEFCSAHLWFRANACNAIAQAVDGFIFFSLAFVGTVAPENIGEIIVTGFIIKAVYMMLASSLLYLNTIEFEMEDEYASVTVR
jgi:uncharacterized integral membrane protein (TIGR00697 family)